MQLHTHQASKPHQHYKYLSPCFTIKVFLLYSFQRATGNFAMISEREVRRRAVKGTTSEDAEYFMQHHRSGGF